MSSALPMQEGDGDFLASQGFIPPALYEKQPFWGRFCHQ